ncbi:MAG: hypothetical protein GWP19_00290 [Planctomycetia bacterium]|nr:hypothetical protein [Planctomycetia bacterium]
MRTINITLEDKDFKKLSNMKESWKILGRCSNWEDFIINCSKLAEIELQGGRASENGKKIRYHRN